MANRTVVTYPDADPPVNGKGLLRVGGEWVQTDLATQAEVDAVAAAAAPVGASYVTTAAEAGLSAENVLGTAVIRQGTTAARPAASAVAAGTLYFATDTAGGTLYRSDATNWTTVGISTVRDRAKQSGLGYLAETAPLSAANSAVAMTNGTVFFSSIGLLAGDVVTGAVITISTAGTLMTLSKMGLYDTAAARLALSADLGTAWESTGRKQGAFTAAYTVLTTGVYYVAAIAIGATQPQAIRTTAQATVGLALGANPRNGAQMAAQTDLPATATFADITSTMIWYGLY